MKKLEYKTITLLLRNNKWEYYDNNGYLDPSNIGDKITLNELGADGWEFDATINSGQFLFKREL